jgi:hypothetical protein
MRTDDMIRQDERRRRRRRRKRANFVGREIEEENEYQNFRCCYVDKKGCQCENSILYWEFCRNHAEIELGMYGM